MMELRKSQFGLMCTNEVPVAKILIDESHGELLCSQVEEGDHEADTWNTLRHKLQDELGMNVDAYISEDSPLTADVLSAYDVLVVAAPTKPFESSEVQAIVNFVRSGKALLISHNAESLWRQHASSTRALLEPFGLRIQRLLSYPPEEISTLYPHYLTSGVRQLLVDEPTYLRLVSDSPEVVAVLPESNKPFLCALDVGAGRLVAIGDFVLLGDGYIGDNDNEKLVLNIFQWLSFENLLDCSNVCYEASIYLGKKSSFSVVLKNPSSKRLENIICTLESDSGAVIHEPVQHIRSISARGQTIQQWVIQPEKLGFQSLKLTIDFSTTSKKIPSLFFEPIAWFQCLPEVEIDVAMPSLQQVETGTSFEIQPVIRWAYGAKAVPLEFDLDVPTPQVMLEAVQQGTTRSWRLTALEPGQWPVTIKVGETTHQITRWLSVRLSLQDEIAAIERDIVKPLTTEINRQMVKVHNKFSEDSVQKISVQILTPEEQVNRLYQGDLAEQLLEAIEIAHFETHTNWPLLEMLLSQVAPTYSPKEGCCIPYAPRLATHLVRIHPSAEENLAHNFLSMEGYDRTWLEQNIAAFLLHEKYGHGFFFTHTTLGKQLAILYRHGMLEIRDASELPSPYPRVLYAKYQEVISLLSDSITIINEGFATWVELVGLQRLTGMGGQVVQRRKNFLFNYDTQLARIAQHSDYFGKFPPFSSSRYREGCEYFEQIQNYFGEVWGTRCAVQAMIKAADIDFGIREQGGQVQFALTPDDMKHALLFDQRDDARADARLRQIHTVLHEYQEQIRCEQKKLQYDYTSSPECPITVIIKEKLGW